MAVASGVSGKYSSGENVNIAPMEASFCALVLNSRDSKSSLTVVKINVATDSEGEAQSPLFTVKFVPSNSIVSFPLVKRKMKPAAIVADEMFPEGAGPYMDIEEAGGSSALLMDLAANEKSVHSDFFNEFEDLFDDEDLS